MRLDKDNKTSFLEEEAEVLVSLFLPEKASYKVESLSELSPELVDQNSRLSWLTSFLNTSLILCVEVQAKAERQWE